MTFTATNSTAAAPRASRAEALRERGNPRRIPIASIRLLEFDENRVGEERQGDRGDEEHRVVELDDAAQDGVEMAEEAEALRRVEQTGRDPIREEFQQHGQAGHGEEETHRR